MARHPRAGAHGGEGEGRSANDASCKRPEEPRTGGCQDSGKGGGMAGGGGLGGLPAGWEGPAAQSSPFSTSAQPLGSFPPRLRAPSSFQPPIASTKPQQRETRGGQGGGWRVDGCTFWPQQEAASCSWQVQAGFGHLPQAAALGPLLGVFHRSGVLRGWDSAAATFPGSHPQQSEQEEDRSHKTRSIP